MYLLDTDHLTEIISETERGLVLKERLKWLDEEVATSIVVYEEMLRGWLAKIHQHNSQPRLQIEDYQRLAKLLESRMYWNVIGWDVRCVEIMERLIQQRVNVKPMDLKIASTALRHKATLLTRNFKDFQRVPGLVFEDWLS